MQDKEVLMKKTSTRTNRWFQVLSTVLCILITFFCLYVIAISIHEKDRHTTLYFGMETGPRAIRIDGTHNS